MRKTIQGQRFDTDSSTRIAVQAAPDDASDERYWYETLYRSPRGMWFLVGEGGVFSRWRGREGVMPLTPELARSWLTEARQHAALERYFGEGAACSRCGSAGAS